MNLRVAHADDVRAFIARHLLGESPHHVGGVVLHRHQELGVGRISRMLAANRGALLADEVGLGKTFVALAVARDYAHPLVVAPAALRDTWIDAARRCSQPVQFLSVESLSRGCMPPTKPALVIVDEAHHLRSRHTRRYEVARVLCETARVLLLTATPVQNRLRDLRAILALFLGERAYGMSELELATHVVRRSSDAVAMEQQLPRVADPLWLRVSPDADCLKRILALPPPVPPADGGDGGALLAYSLVRQWASSRAALRAALKRRIARGRAIEDALAVGLLPSRRELRSWVFADDAQQLAFPELAVEGVADDGPRLLDHVRAHVGATRELLQSLDDADDPDPARAQALRGVMEATSGARVVAFSEYAETISGYFRLLHGHVRAAKISHAGGRVAGGILSRREILARFAGDDVRGSDRIDLLLATDLLSEGVNLQAASVVVHLDLPWNPARLEQRVGRLRRIGAARDVIDVYAMEPPAPTERLLQIERRLRSKIADAGRTVGIAGAILPGFSTSLRAEPLGADERITGAAAVWQSRFATHPVIPGCVGAVTSSVAGALALVRMGEQSGLVAISDPDVTDSRAAIARLVIGADGDDVPLDEAFLAGVRERLDRWLRQRSIGSVVDVASLHVGRSRRAVLRRVDRIAQGAPRHAQSSLAPLVHAARAAAIATLSAGAERVLDELSLAPLDDMAWLHAVREFASLHARSGDVGDAEITAILLLQRQES